MHKKYKVDDEHRRLQQQQPHAHYEAKKIHAYFAGETLDHTHNYINAVDVITVAHFLKSEAPKESRGKPNEEKGGNDVDLVVVDDGSEATMLDWQLLRMGDRHRRKHSHLVSSVFSEMIHRLADSCYLGELQIRGTAKTMHVWRKEAIDINPPVVLDEVVCDRKPRLFVVRDDLLPGGTKQRAWKAVQALKEKEIVYAGPWNGFAQVALAIACKLCGKTATVFTTRSDYRTNIRARMYGCNLICKPHTQLKDLQVLARTYASGKDAYVMPFGFDADEFRVELVASLKDACRGVLDFNKSYEFWLVAGSATLVNVLYQVFPVANFHIVQVGKTVWPDQIDEKRTTKYIAPESFYDEAVEQPPYPSAATYDAKLWQFARKHAKEDAVIWNVAGHSVPSF